MSKEAENLMKAMKELQTLRARVEELECAEAELNLENGRLQDRLNAILTITKRGKRITDLESQLAAAREEQGLEARVREVLGERFFKVRIGRYREFWLAEWREVVRGETLERFADAETLAALLRAILDTEEKPR